MLAENQTAKKQNQKTEKTAKKGREKVSVGG